MTFTSKASPILVIIGPSGAGKSSTVRKLVDEGIVAVTPSWTTRIPRPGEIEDTTEHRFIDDDEFNIKETEGYFLETVQMFGLPFRYGLAPIEQPIQGQVSLVMLRASLLPLFQKYYPNNVIYQIEDDLARIEQRLLERQAHGEPMGTRLSEYKKEIDGGKQFASRIFINNENIEALTEKIRNAIATDFPKQEKT
jgi:guanylate kinase